MRWFEVSSGGVLLVFMDVFEGRLFLSDVGWRLRGYLSGNGKEDVASMGFWSWEHSDNINCVGIWSLGYLYMKD